MSAPAQRLPNSCVQLLWDADTVFFNPALTDATVSLVGMSNGLTAQDSSTTFTVSAGGFGSIRQKTEWTGIGTGTLLWIDHVTAPSGVRVDGEMFPSTTNTGCPSPVAVSQAFGKTQLPVYRQLVPAGRKQTITGLTLGALAAHMNIGIYNAGAAAGSATIEIHRACDGVMTETRSVSVLPDTVQQFNGFTVPATPLPCAGGHGVSFWSGLNGLAYAVVTVDQPSLTFGSILSAADVPTSNIQNVPVSTTQVMPGIAQ